MRMSDIIKIGDKSSAQRKKFSYRKIGEEIKKAPGLQRKSRMPLYNKPLDDARLMHDGRGIDGLYRGLLAEVRSIFSKASVDFHILPSKDVIYKLVRDIVDYLLLQDVDIMKLFIRYTEDNYIFAHSVNVTFMSVMLGVWLNYNKSSLNQVGIAALLHDIGMVRVLRLSGLPRGLTPAERRQIDEHPNYGREFVSLMPDAGSKVIDAVHYHHKRLNDSSTEINEYSQIIGLVDILEALTHPRAYRKRIKPHAAIRVVIEELRGDFNSGIIKALVDNIGIYPQGTWVRLDTEEVAFVIDVNPGFPLSPKINVLFDRRGDRLDRPRTVNLLKQKNINIKAPLENEDILRLKRIL